MTENIETYTYFFDENNHIIIDWKYLYRYRKLQYHYLPSVWEPDVAESIFVCEVGSLGIIDLFVGVLELLSEFIRIVSFTFRLFGNMTAGEILLLVSGFLVSFVFTIPFYGLELLVGFIQALIFAGLTLVFISVAVTPHEHEEEHA